MALANLHQFNRISYSEHSFILLDLIFCNDTNIDLRVKEADFGVVRPDGYHPLLELTLNLEPLRETANVFRFNFRKANLPAKNQELVKHNWDVMGDMEINEAVSYFYDVLNDVITKFVPQSQPARRYPPWFTRQLIIELKNKRKFHKKYKKLNTIENYYAFRSRANCRIIASQAFEKYLEDSKFYRYRSGEVLGILEK